MKTGINDTVFPLRRTRPLILAFLLVSGSCGLIYEILWMKMLTLVIGNTVFAITTVLIAFMGGLALGSFLAGRLIDRITDPLRTYGILEGGIGAYALLLPFFIAATQPLFRIIYQGVNPSFYTFSLIRFAVCGIILLIPTTLMGATLPVLSKHFVERQSDVGWNVGLLYGINTFGAVLGSIAAGFVLIPNLGVNWTIYLAALLNLSICFGMVKLAKTHARPADSGSPGTPLDDTPEKEEPEVVPESRWGPIQWTVAAGIGVSGIAAMIYQIAWTKVLLLSIGSSVYAFSLIVTAFIAGLAIGSLAVAKFIDRGKDLALSLALVQGAIGLSALLIVPLLGKLPIFLTESVFSVSKSFPYIHAVEFAVLFVLMVVPTFMMGAAVPLAIKICATDVRRVATFFGNVYAVNTIGAIFGSFVAGFFLIPWFGAQNSIFIAVAMNITVAIAIFLQAPSRVLSRRMAWAFSTAAIAVAVWVPIGQWDANVLISGPYLYAGQYLGTSNQKGIDIGTAMKAGRKLLYYKEGLNAVVSVDETPHGDLLLGVNGKTDASAKGGDVATQLILGHLPLLLHPGAEDVLVIGLGSGMTLGAVEKHPVNAVDVVEIEAAVVEASRYFRKFTGDALADPRVNLIVADGRNHVALTASKYDVIISEPSNPWIAGMANLFTREFSDLAKKRLKKGGLMCQWVQAYAMTSQDFKTIVATFQAVFPHVTLWEASLGGDYLLIGSPGKIRIDPRALTDRMKGQHLKADLGKMKASSPAALLSKLILTEAVIPAYVEGTPLHTDGNARLEYSAPRSLHQRRSPELLKALYAHRQNPAKVLQSGESIEIPPAMESEILQRVEARNDVLAGYISLTNGEVQAAIEHFEQAMAKNPEDDDVAYRLASLYQEIGDKFKQKKRSNEAALAYEKSIETVDKFTRGNRALLADHLKLEMIYAEANLDLGTLALKAERLKEAEEALTRSVSGGVRSAQGHNNLGVVYERGGRYGEAATQYQLAVELEPGNVAAHMNLGNAYLKLEKYPEAIESYLQVKELRPDFALTHYNLGAAYFQQHEWAKAEKEWERALALKPDFPQAQKSLENVRGKIKSHNLKETDPGSAEN